MTSAVLKFAAFGLFALKSVYGSSGRTCDASAAEKFVQEIEVFNSKLESYASLVGSNVVTTTRLSFQKDDRLFDKRAERTHEAAENDHKQYKKLIHNTEVQPTVVYTKKADTKLPVHIAPNIVTKQAHVHTVTPKHQQEIHFSTYIPVEQQRHNLMIQESLKSLMQQQSILDSMETTCIPNSHKTKIISAFSKTFSLYLTHRKNLVSADNLAKRAQHAQAGWLTMGNGINSGYNGDEADFTSSSSSTTATATQGYGFGYAEYPPPQYSPQYITITVSPSTLNAPTSTDSNDGSDDGSDDSGDDGDDSSPSTAVPAAPPLPTSPHHGLLYESTIGLILGSLHLVERIFGIGGSRQAIGSPVSALSELVEKVSNEYKVKI